MTLIKQILVNTILSCKRVMDRNQALLCTETMDLLGMI